VVATGGNRSQITSTRKRLKQGKTVAAGCDRLPQAAHGTEGVGEPRFEGRGAWDTAGCVPGSATALVLPALRRRGRR
jgi:hypothetical protein